MPKQNVWENQAPCYPVNKIELQGRTKLYTFFLKKQDSLDEIEAGKLCRKMCENYLGEPVEWNKATRKITKRKDPKHFLRPIPQENGGLYRVTPNEDLFFNVAQICIMQDWPNQPQECYEPEELIALIFTDKEVWDTLQEKAETINGNPQGNACSEAGESKSAPSSETSTTTQT